MTLTSEQHEKHLFNLARACMSRFEVGNNYDRAITMDEKRPFGSSTQWVEDTLSAAEVPEGMFDEYAADDYAAKLWRDLPEFMSKRVELRLKESSERRWDPTGDGRPLVIRPDLSARDPVKHFYRQTPLREPPEPAKCICSECGCPRDDMQRCSECGSVRVILRSVALQTVGTYAVEELERKHLLAVLERVKKDPASYQITPIGDSPDTDRRETTIVDCGRYVAEGEWSGIEPAEQDPTMEGPGSVNLWGMIPRAARPEGHGSRGPVGRWKIVMEFEPAPAEEPPALWNERDL